MGGVRERKRGREPERSDVVPKPCETVNVAGEQVILSGFGRKPELLK